MKYIERLKKEHPECVSNEFTGGCEGCPEDYGYEPYRNTCPSGSEQLSVEEACRRCWRREMAEHAPDQKARDWFRRPAGVQVMIRAQAEQIRDTTKYVAEKYNIRGDADGRDRREDSE